MRVERTEAGMPRDQYATINRSIPARPMSITPPPLS
ncbi:hypothetical protein CsSME_00017723 [Camellia sinensis var. sinensis]